MKFTRDMFEWDEGKRESNIAKHQVDFAAAISVFSSSMLKVVPDNRKDYGEERFNAYGISNDGNKMRICFTERNNKIRVISMHKVNNKDWEKVYG